MLDLYHFLPGILLLTARIPFCFFFFYWIYMSLSTPNLRPSLFLYSILPVNCLIDFFFISVLSARFPSEFQDLFFFSEL